MRHILLAALCLLTTFTLVAQESYVVNSTSLSTRFQVDITPGICSDALGEILINSVTSEPLTYSLDGEIYQNENLFTALEAGAYRVYIKDSKGHQDSLHIDLRSSDSFSISDISTSPSTCGEQSGKLLIEPLGGKAPYSFALNHGYPQQDEYFDQLDAGTYHVQAIDANGCTVDTTITITQTGCPVYIPNIFSPNGDGVNDYFQIQTADENNVLITRFLIFDRWGSKVYEKYNLPIHSSDGWWDGTYKRFTMNKGQFAYFVEVEFENGDRETFRGNVALIR